jgi:hypothetical protein
MRIILDIILIFVKLIYLIIVCAPITIMLLIFINLIDIFKTTKQCLKQFLKRLKLK